MTQRTKIVLGLIVMGVVLFYAACVLGTSTSSCLSMRWWGAHEVKAGWYGDVKCVRGSVVDER